jgi:YVTN family beta-propeller protein
MSKFSQQLLSARTSGARSFRASRFAQSTLAFGAAAFVLTGCGSNLRPTTTPIVGTGPASQPPANAFVISVPSSSSVQGIGTVIDYAGDTIMATASIGPSPTTFTTSSSGGTAWTLNSDGTVSNIPVTNTLQNKNVLYSTLSPIPTTGPFTGLDPVSALYSGAAGFYALDVNANVVDVLTGSPDAFKLTVDVDKTPVTMEGVGAATRLYSVSQIIDYGMACNTNPSGVGVNGVADAIDTATYTVTAQIPVGVCPVYAIGTPDTKRVFVLNRGSDTITVINSQNNALDQCPVPLVVTPPSTVPSCPAPYNTNQIGQPITYHPALPLSLAAVNALNTVTPGSGNPPNGTTGLPAVAGPVYAEYNQKTGLLVVSNYDGNTINIIDVSLDQYGNDSATFGTTYTVQVGKNPAAVTVLADGTRAYVANQSDSTVTIVNLSSHTIEKTLPVQGHPRSVVSTQNSLYGKVYVVSPDNPFVSIIRTDQDILSTTVLVQGNPIDVRTNSPDTTSANANTVSRMPGAGQPCYLPPASFTGAGAAQTIANCKVQDPTLLTAAP